MELPDHAEWERWCEEWNDADFKAYPDFDRWQNTFIQAEKEEALTNVLNQAEGNGDAKMARAVYRRAPSGSTAQCNALRFALEHARKTDDKLLALDVYLQARHAGLSSLPRMPTKTSQAKQ